MSSPNLFKRPLFWGCVAFGALVVLPLYVTLVVVAVRTKLFDLDGGQLSDEQYKAIWAFLGVALTMAATIMGAILTKSSSDKSLAQQRESEGRQKLDTAVQALELIKTDDKYAPKAVVAGALATLVHLGHPTIAMRTTEVAIGDDAVAVETAVWLIDQVLRADTGGASNGTGTSSQAEAASLLQTLASELAVEAVPGYFNFPSLATAAWPGNLNAVASLNLLDALIGLLLSQDYTWWGKTGWTWVLFTIDELVAEPSTDEEVRWNAATYGMRLLPVVISDGVLVAGYAENREPSDIAKRLSPFASEDGGGVRHWVAVCDWCDAAASNQGR